MALSTIFLVSSFLVLSIGLTILQPISVYGHAFVLDSNPPPSESLERPPARVEVFLSEPVDDSYSEIKVIGPDGNQVDNKDTQHLNGDESTLGVTLPSDLENGAYTVSTKMLSQIDGHVTEDAFVFGIGENTPISSTSGQAEQETGSPFDQLSLPDALARFPALVGQVIVVGAAFCTLWLWRPFAKISLFNGPPSMNEQEFGKHGNQKKTSMLLLTEAASRFRKSMDQRMIKIMLVAASIVIVADFAMIYALAYSLGIGIVDAMTTKFGGIWFIRTAISVLLFTLILFVYLNSNKKVPVLSKNRKIPNEQKSIAPVTKISAGYFSLKYVIAILVVGTLTLLTTSLMGHGAAITSGTQIPITIDFVHNLAASIWIGGVLYLALAVVPRLRIDNSLNDRIKCGILSIMIPRFSTLPVVVLGIIVITGPVLLYLLEDDLNLTLASLYGKALLAKLVFAAIMLIIGGYNQRIIHRNAIKALTWVAQLPQEGQQQQLIVSSSKYSKISDLPPSTAASTYFSSDFSSFDEENSGLVSKISFLLKDVRQKFKFRSNRKGGANRERDGMYGGSDKNSKDNIDSPPTAKGPKTSKSTIGGQSKQDASITWSKTISSFTRSIRTEAIFGLLLLAAVAVLTNTGLPASEFQGQLQQQASQGASQTNIQNLLITTSGANNGIGVHGSGGGESGYSDTQYLENATARIKLEIKPFVVGNNNFEIRFLDMAGNPIDIRTAGMKLTQTEENIGPIDIQTRKISKGLFTANASFGLAGEWDLVVEGVRNEVNALDLVATFKLFVKPDLDQIDYSITQIAMPSNRSQPLYPIFDSSRNSIWVGDTSLSSGRIFEYDISGNKYHEIKINGTNIVTTMALDPSNDRIWFIDPISKLLGVYNPQQNNSKLYSLPNDRVVPSSVAFRSAEFPTANVNNNSSDGNTAATRNVTSLDTGNNSQTIESPATVWVTSPSTGEVLMFDTEREKFTNIIPLPTPNSNPLGITIDPSTGKIWVAEGVGKIANIDPSINLTVTEFLPGASSSSSNSSSNSGTAASVTEAGSENDTLISPTYLLIDPNTGSIYISEHDGHVVSVFNPIFKTFSDFPPMAEDSLPFGMALDKDRNLWVAEHVTNRLTVIDPSTGKTKEVTLPISAPFVQYLTTDNDGRIWFAAQRGNSLGYITSSVNPLQGASSSSSLTSTQTSSSAVGQENEAAAAVPGGDTLLTPLFNVGFEYLLGPVIAIGIVVAAAYYIKSVVNLKLSIRQVNALTTPTVDDNKRRRRGGKSSKYP